MSTNSTMPAAAHISAKRSAMRTAAIAAVTSILPAMAILLAMAILPAMAAQPAGADYGGHMWGGGWHGGMFAGFVMMVLFVALVVVLAALAFRWLVGRRLVGGPPGGRPNSGAAAIEILRDRFARGEIDAAEFEERRKLLEE